MLISISRRDIDDQLDLSKDKERLIEITDILVRRVWLRLVDSNVR